MLGARGGEVVAVAVAVAVARERPRRNSGGVAIIEVDSAATLAQTTAPFTPWLRFTAKPIVPIEDSAAIAGSGIAFRDTATEAPG